MEETLEILQDNLGQALNTLRTHVFSYRELDRGQLAVAAASVGAEESAGNQEA